MKDIGLAVENSDCDFWPQRLWALSLLVWCGVALAARPPVPIDECAYGAFSISVTIVYEPHGSECI